MDLIIEPDQEDLDRETEYYAMMQLDLEKDNRDARDEERKQKSSR